MKFFGDQASGEGSQRGDKRTTKKGKRAKGLRKRTETRKQKWQISHRRLVCALGVDWVGVKREGSKGVGWGEVLAWTGANQGISNSLEESIEGGREAGKSIRGGKT